MANDNQGVPHVNAGRIVGGLIVLALGVMMLLDRTDILRGYDAGRLLPGVVLIVIGLGQLGRGPSLRRGCYRRGAGGLWLVVVGAWLLASELRLFGLTYHTSWPLLIIAIGVLMVLRAVFVPDQAAGPSSGAPQGRD